MIGNSIALCFIGMCLNYVHGSRIVFYENWNNQGYLFESNSASSCTNIPSIFNGSIKGSIKTDTCIMIYTGKDCTEYSLKFKPGAENFWNIKYHSGASSYHICNENEGGSQSNVDFYGRHNLKGSIVASYKDVCACQNLPKHVQEMTALSVNNHGNSIVVFKNDDCKGEGDYISKTIHAGRSKDSDQINEFEFVDWSSHGEYFVTENVRSFRPHSKDYPKHCFKLYSNVYKVECSDSIEDQPIEMGNVELLVKTTFRNNQSEKSTQEILATKMIRETVEFEIASRFEIENMYNVDVDASVKVDYHIAIPFIEKSKFVDGVKLAFKFVRTNLSGKSDRKPIIVENEKEVSIKQSIEVPPCTEYTVQAFVKMRKNKIINCKIHSNVTGEYGTKKMNRWQIRSHLEKFHQRYHRDAVLEYVTDSDEYEHSVNTMAKGLIKLEYGINSVISGDRKKILDCGQKMDSGDTPRNFSFQCSTEGRLVDPSISIKSVNISSEGLPVKVEYLNYGNIEPEKGQLICKKVAGMEDGEYLCKTTQFGSVPSEDTNKEI